MRTRISDGSFSKKGAVLSDFGVISRLAAKLFRRAQVAGSSTSSTPAISQDLDQDNGINFHVLVELLYIISNEGVNNL
jgi:hypothetical protein